MIRIGKRPAFQAACQTNLAASKQKVNVGHEKPTFFVWLVWPSRSLFQTGLGPQEMRGIAAPISHTLLLMPVRTLACPRTQPDRIGNQFACPYMGRL